MLSRRQFGSSKITRARESGEIISLADDLKAAATDALKKAATLLGVGLHLYRGSDPPQTGSKSSNRAPESRDLSQPPHGNGKANGTYKHGNQQPPWKRKRPAVRQAVPLHARHWTKDRGRHQSPSLDQPVPGSLRRQFWHSICPSVDASPVIERTFGQRATNRNYAQLSAGGRSHSSGSPLSTF